MNNHDCSYRRLDAKTRNQQQQQEKLGAALGLRPSVTPSFWDNKNWKEDDNMKKMLN